MILSGRDIRWYLETGELSIEPITEEQFQQNGVDLILEDLDGHPAEFEPLTFALAATREILTFPDDLMAFVELRSTWARSGLLLPPTIVDAGFSGNLTLEIFAARRLPVPYGERFAHLIFARLTGPSMPYRGKYQGQRGITGPRADLRSGGDPQEMAYDSLAPTRPGHGPAAASAQAMSQVQPADPERPPLRALPEGERPDRRDVREPGRCANRPRR